MATSSVEFSIENVMDDQIDGVAMRSSLGPDLANIFVGYHESKLFQITFQPQLDYHYMDDTLVVFNNKDECNLLF